MSNHTYHVSLYRIDSRWVIIDRLVSVAGKIGFFSHRRLYYYCKAKTAEVFDMNLFQQQLKEGKTGEELVYNWLTSRGYHVYDVSDDVDWQAKDVDFLAFSADDVLKIEVKKDNNANWTGNVICELVSNMKTGKDGWWLTCKADRLIVVMAPTKYLVIDLPTMQHLIDTGELVWDSIKDLQFQESSHYYKDSRCGLIKISKLISAGIAEIYLI